MKAATALLYTENTVHEYDTDYGYIAIDPQTKQVLLNMGLCEQHTIDELKPVLVDMEDKLNVLGYTLGFDEGGIE